MNEPKTIRVKRYDLCAANYSVAPHWYRTADSCLGILIPFDEFEGEELDVTISVVVPKSAREKRADILESWIGYRGDTAEMAQLLDALEAIDRGER